MVGWAGSVEWATRAGSARGTGGKRKEKEKEGGRPHFWGLLKFEFLVGDFLINPQIFTYQILGLSFGIRVLTPHDSFWRTYAQKIIPKKHVDNTATNNTQKVFFLNPIFLSLRFLTKFFGLLLDTS